MILSLNVQQRTATFNNAMVEIDIDPEAERYVVADRKSMSVLWHGVRPSVGNAKVVVPFNYTIDNNIMVLILDDAGSPTYYAAVNDKVQAQIVDGRTVKTNP